LRSAASGRPTKPGFIELLDREHQAELDAEDRRIRAHVAEQVRPQHLRFPPAPRKVRLALMKETLSRRR
jgi:hypothetical protein